MKHVSKGALEPSFENWKVSDEPFWDPSYGDLQNPEKRNLHDFLLQEQGWVCCYCGREIAQKDSHIEHFRPQEHFEDLALTQSNMFASCIRETKPGTPLHCGHAKGGNFDEEMHISPLDADCESRFKYTLDGQILATELADHQAAYMVGLLHLDISFLRNRRAEEINRVFDQTFLASATDLELQSLRDAYRARDAQGRAQSFGHVVARFAEQRLLDSAP